MQSALLDRTIVHGWRNVTSETKVLDGLKDTAFQTAPDIRSVDSAELLAGPLGVGAHAALADNHTDAGVLHKLVLELLHPHGGGGAYGDHLVVILGALDLVELKGGQ